MNAIQDAITGFQKLNDNIETIIEETLRETAEYLTDDIKEQLFSGIDGSGSKIVPRYKSASYANKKFSMNSKPGLFTPDLKYSGDFYEGIFTTIQKPSLFIGSTVDYASFLETKYSKEILEPTKENLNDYINKYFIPVLFANIETVTGLRFHPQF